MLSNETFVWFCDFHETSTGLVLATGQGPVVSAAQREAYATLEEMTQGRKVGTLARASAVACVKDAKHRAFLLLSCDSKVPGAQNLWQFPSKYVLRDELPLHCAVRALAAQAGLREQEQPREWAAARVRVGGRDVTWLDDEGMQRFRARWAAGQHTVEFFYPMTLEVPNLPACSAYSKILPRSQAALLSDADVSELYARGLLTSGSAAVWHAAVEDGVVFDL